MFTGIIEEVGEVIEINDTGDFRTIRVRGRTVLDDLRVGSSIAVNGVCLTARSVAADGFSAEMSGETLARTIRFFATDLRPSTDGRLRPPILV